MDLELLVIGATSAGWQVANAAAQAGSQVGLVGLAPRPDALRADLRQLPDQLLRDLCADWPLLRPLQGANPGRDDITGWRQFTDFATQAWRQEQADSRDRFLANGGLMWTGSPEMIDSHTVGVQDSMGRSLQIAAQSVLLASGTRSQQPRFAEPQLPGVFSAAGLLDATSIPRTACVVGAGMTGLRAACLLAWWGAKVVVVDGCYSSEDFVEPQTAEWFRWAEELGVQFDCGEDVIGMRKPRPGQVALTLESGRHLVSESVWLATGRTGETADLHLDRARVSVDDRGRLWCDNQHRTWSPSIYAAGDVVGFCPSRHSEAEMVGSLVHSMTNRQRTRHLELAGV